MANSQITVPLFKTPEADPKFIRPVGIKSSLVRVLHSEVILSKKGAIREYLEPHQLALTPGGGAKIMNAVRMMSESRPDFVVVSMDIRNAHNEVSRSAIVKSFKSVQSLRHLSLHMATHLAPEHRLEASGEAWGTAPEGHEQGDPEAGTAMNVTIQPAVKKLHRMLAAAGGLAIFGNDDGFAVGPPEITFKAVEEFAREVFEKCNLTLQVEKTKVYHESGAKPPQAPENMPAAGEEVERVVAPRIQVLRSIYRILSLRQAQTGGESEAVV